MPKSRKNSEREEQVRKDKKGLARVEALRPKSEQPDKLYNDLAKFPSENPYPVMRIHRDGTVLYANKASEPLLKARGSGIDKPAPKEWHRLVEDVLTTGKIARKEVKDDGRVFALRAVPIVDSNYVNFYGVDITELKTAEEERQLTIGLLSLINCNNQMQELMKLVTVLLKDWSGCEAVGIRLQEGEDFPYYVTSGFPEEFVLAENKLCSVNEIGEIVRDKDGKPFLECMCGNIISGRFDPLKSFFTEHGSFWTNSTTDLLVGTTEAALLTKIRNRCNTTGYESLALIPLRAGRQTFGLLQFNSKQRGRFTPEKISLLERLADNLAIGLAQRRAEQTLIKEKKLSEELINSSVDGILAYDHQFRYTIWNPGMERISGVKKEEALGRCAFDVFPFLKETGEDKFFYDALAGKTVVAKDRPYRVPQTGKKGFFEGHYAPLYVERGNIIGGLAVIRNITERKRAEEALRESELKYRSLFKSSLEGIGLSKDNQVIDANPALLDIFGYDSLEEFLKVPLLEHVAPESRDFIQEKLNKLKTGEPTEQKFEYKIIRKDGKIRDLDISIGHVRIGNTLYSLSTFNDITEQKRAERALREGEERLNAALDAAELGIWDWDISSGRMMWGGHHERLFGFKEGQFDERLETFKKIVYPGDREGLEAAVEKSHQEKSEYWHEFRIVRPDGTIRWMLGKGQSKYDQSGRPVRMLGTVQDITERKLAEEALLFTRFSVDNAVDTMACVGHDGHFIDVNNAFCRISGYSREELLSMTVHDIDPYYSAEIWPEFWEKLKQSGSLTFESCHRTKKGKVFPVEVTASYFEYNGKEYHCSFARDITERKRAEEALRESEERLNTALDAAELGIWDWDMVSGQITWAGHYNRLLGFEDEDFDGRYETFEKRVHPDDLEGLRAAGEKSKTEKSEYSHEFRVVYPDGTVRWISSKGRCQYDQTGQAVRMLGTVQDITKRKKAEELLKKSEEKFSKAFKAVPAAVTISTIEDGRYIDVNDVFLKISGFQRDEVIGHKAAELKVWLKDDQRRQYMEELAKIGSLRNFEFQFRMHNGEIRDFLASSELIELEGEQCSLNFVLDITERKQAEEHLQEERNLLRTLIDHIPDGVYVKDKDSRFVAINNAVTEYWDTKGQGDIIGKTDFDFFDKDKAQRYFDEEQEIIRTGQPIINLERPCTSKTGKTNWVLATKVPLRDSHGNITGIVGINHSITERKVAEIKLLEYQKQLKQLASQLSLVEERERRRIAGELHDQVGQSLALAKIKLDALRASATIRPADDVLAEVSETLKQVVDETRSLTFDLSYPILYELGFETAISEWLNEQVRDKSGIAVEFADDSQPKPLDDDVRVLLFRNVRELLINCIKHANADRIKVGVRRIKDSIEITVEDNGVGFDAAEAKIMTAPKAGFGLFSIRENLEELGGYLEIESKPGAGCKTVMTAPLKGQPRKKEE